MTVVGVVEAGRNVNGVAREGRGITYALHVTNSDAGSSSNRSNFIMQNFVEEMYEAFSEGRLRARN